MRIIFLFLFFACSLLYGQNTLFTDTIFSGKYFFDRIEHSNINKLTTDLESKCITKELTFSRVNNLDYNHEYSILLDLNAFNQFSKSTIFTDNKCFIYSKFCYNCDFLDDITLIEFHFSDNLKCDIFKKKIQKIINDKEFFNYPQEKLFYYKIVSNNICYLLISIKDNQNNVIFNELKSRIERIE